MKETTEKMQRSMQELITMSTDQFIVACSSNMKSPRTQQEPLEHSYSSPISIDTTN
jgi:hypothetical protein